MNYDLIIVGSGPAGIFTALELIKRGTKKKMLLIEKGKPVEKRHCPKAEVGHCVNCKPSCAITTGFSGAGAFSDGKLSLSYEVGGDLPMLIGEDFAQELKAPSAAGGGQDVVEYQRQHQGPANQRDDAAQVFVVFLVSAVSIVSVV